MATASESSVQATASEARGRKSRRSPKAKRTTRRLSSVDFESFLSEEQRVHWANRRQEFQAELAMREWYRQERVDHAHAVAELQIAVHAFAHNGVLTAHSASKPRSPQLEKSLWPLFRPLVDEILSELKSAGVPDASIEMVEGEVKSAMRFYRAGILHFRASMERALTVRIEPYLVQGQSAKEREVIEARLYQRVNHVAFSGDACAAGMRAMRAAEVDARGAETFEEVEQLTKHQVVTSAIAWFDHAAELMMSEFSSDDWLVGLDMLAQDVLLIHCLWGAVAVRACRNSLEERRAFWRAKAPVPVKSVLPKRRVGRPPSNDSALAELKERIRAVGNEYKRARQREKILWGEAAVYLDADPAAETKHLPKDANWHDPKKQLFVEYLGDDVPARKRRPCVAWFSNVASGRL